MNPTEVVKKTGTATLSVVASTSTSPGALLLAGNAARKGAIISNASTAILYILYGAVSTNGVPSATNHTIQVATLITHKVDDGYLGDIYGIWVAANGNAMCTELT